MKRLMGAAVLPLVLTACDTTTKKVVESDAALLAASNVNTLIGWVALCCVAAVIVICITIYSILEMRKN